MLVDGDDVFGLSWIEVSIKRMYAGYAKDKSSSFRKQIYPAALDDLERIKNSDGGR